jgi:hypothetical protein
LGRTGDPRPITTGVLGYESFPEILQFWIFQIKGILNYMKVFGNKYPRVIRAMIFYDSSANRLCT